MTDHILVKALLEIEHKVTQGAITKREIAQLCAATLSEYANQGQPPVNDTKPYVTGQHHYHPMDTAPLGKKVLAVNEGGTACFAVLNRDNLSHYLGWFELPRVKR